MRDIQKSRALQCCRLLIDAYQNGEDNGGSIKWEQVDAAYAVALEAIRGESFAPHIAKGRR